MIYLENPPFWRGGNAWRAIHFHKSDKIDELALKRLILAAVALNGATNRAPLDGIKKSPETGIFLEKLHQ